MSAKLPRPRRPAGGEKSAQRGEPDEARLWHIGAALAMSFTVAVLGLGALAWLAWALIDLAGFRRHGALSLHDTVGVAQLVFASIAGAGALVALVVAYRRQKVAEADSAHDRTRVFNERFTTIATQLGETEAAVRLAGVHAMAGLADDWKANRQTCIDVLCAYLRMPYEPDPGEKAPAPERLAFLASREVRHTVIRVITAHLQDDAAVSWQGLNFDFRGVVFDGGDFRGAVFTIGPGKTRPSRVTFKGATFSDGRVDFVGATFSGGMVDFWDTVFCGDGVSFGGAFFSGAEVSFGGAEFRSGWVSFRGATFSSGKIDFKGAKFKGSEVFYGESAKFTGGTVAFWDAEFSGSKVDFKRTAFSGSTVPFGGAKFYGGTVDFSQAEFSDGVVDLSDAADWSVPPKFSRDNRPPTTVVKFPAAADGQS